MTQKNLLNRSFVSVEDKNVLTNKKKKSWFQNLPLQSLKFLKMQLLRLSENHENHKNS